MARPKVTPALTKVVKKKKKPSNNCNGFIIGKRQPKVIVRPSNLAFPDDDSDLDQHSEIHEPKPFICERCNVSSYPDMAQLKLHLNHCPFFPPFRIGKCTFIERKSKIVIKTKSKAKSKIKMEPEENQDEIKIEAMEVCGIKPVSTLSVFPVEYTNFPSKVIASKKCYNLRRHVSVKPDDIENVITVPISILSQVKNPNLPLEMTPSLNLKRHEKLKSIENLI